MTWYTPLSVMIVTRLGGLSEVQPAIGIKIKLSDGTC